MLYISNIIEFSNEEIDSLSKNTLLYAFKACVDKIEILETYSSDDEKAKLDTNISLAKNQLNEFLELDIPNDKIYQILNHLIEAITLTKPLDVLGLPKIEEIFHNFYREKIQKYHFSI